MGGAVSRGVAFVRVAHALARMRRQPLLAAAQQEAAMAIVEACDDEYGGEMAAMYAARGEAVALLLSAVQNHLDDPGVMRAVCCAAQALGRCGACRRCAHRTVYM